VFGSSGEFHIRGCLESVESPQKKTKRMPWLQLCKTNLPKNSGRTSEKARNHGSHLQWEAGAQPGGGGIWGICLPTEISKHCIAIFTFVETFKE